MQEFHRELIARLPLASAALELLDFAFEPQWLEEIYERHRGRCYTAELTFSDFFRLIRDCLLIHRSGHRGLREAEANGRLPVDDSSFYRKLARMPLAVSQALLSSCTARLGEVMPTPDAVALPACFDELEVVVIDGKKVKDAAKRLKPCRGYSGKLLGAKVLVAMSVRRGLALAMNGDVDGERNDIPLVPGLLSQVRPVIGRAMLFIADRQFADLHTPRLLQGGERGDQYLLNIRRGISFEPDERHPTLEGADAAGRRFIDQIGWIGKGKDRLRVRRIELQRDGDDERGPLILISSLLDRETFKTVDLLELYRRRWGIEQVFQQVSEQFDLRQLIGSTPQAVLFQSSFCLLLYNLLQVIKGYVAEDGGRGVGEVSTHQLFVDVRKELGAWAYLAAPPPPQTPQTPPQTQTQTRSADAAAMRLRLRHLTRGVWRDLWIKKSDKNPRKPRAKPKPLPGGHSSVWRMLQRAKEQEAMP